MSESATETPVLDLFAGMTAASVEASSSIGRHSCSFAPLRLPRSMPHLSRISEPGAAGEAGIDDEQVRGVLAGSHRSSARRESRPRRAIVDAIEVTIEVAELEEEESKARCSPRWPSRPSSRGAALTARAGHSARQVPGTDRRTDRAAGMSSLLLTS